MFGWYPGRHYTAEDLALAQDLARRAALALANARLHRQMQALTTLRERERIGRDLHDGIIQDLYALTLELDQEAEEATDPEQQERLQGLDDRVRGVMGDVRRYIQGLPAQAQQGRSLTEVLAALVQEVDGRGGVAVAWVVEGVPAALLEPAEAALLQIAREALSNVVKHAQAQQAQVSLVYQAGAVELRVTDDGQGFDPAAEPGADHHGLRNLRARAAKAGGTLTLRSAVGAGTTLRVSLPVPDGLAS